MIVYLLHFNRAYPARGGDKRHYIGLTKYLPARLKQHGTKNGARFLEVVAEAGITWEPVRTWYAATAEEARQLEIKLKRSTEHALICPLCRPARLKRKREYEQRRRQQRRTA